VLALDAQGTSTHAARLPTDVIYALKKILNAIEP